MPARSSDGRALAENFKRGDRVFVAGLAGEPQLLRDALLRDPERAAGVEFTSIQLPGVDRTDYLKVHPESRICSFFMTPAVRAGISEERARLFPLDYTGIRRHLLGAAPFDCAIAQFTPPDEWGWCTPGLSADFAPLVWQRAKRRVGHLNPELPRLASGFRVHISEFDSIVDCPAPALSVDRILAGEVNKTIAGHAASLIRDGDTLQFGIGAALPEVASALHSHRRLRIHSGMVSYFLEPLWESGALDRDANVITGLVIGDARLYDYVGRMNRIHLDDVRVTHGIDVLSKIERFVAINSAVEVDLLGQINSERSGGALQAGPGGLPAFAQASQQSPGGRLMICMTATARGGKVSRIVPALGADSICTAPRFLADAVVTEFGVAELRHLSITERPEALIAIAHPDHRAGLATAWDDIRRRL